MTPRKREGNEPIDYTTREFCGRCHALSAVGFFVSKEMWLAVAGRWEHAILCLRCFAQLGDEKHIAWEEGIEFYAVSYATHHAARSTPHSFVDVGNVGRLVPDTSRGSAGEPPPEYRPRGDAPDLVQALIDSLEPKETT